MHLISAWMFKPVAPHRLGVARALFYFWYGVQLLYYGAADWVNLPKEFWEPTLLMTLWAQAPRLSTAMNATLHGLLLLAILGSSLGVLTRWSTTFVALVGTWYLAMAGCFGHADFQLYPIVLISWILPFTACSEAFSLDARTQEPVLPSGRFRWPLRLAHLTLLLPMASAGVHKVLGGWLWHPVATLEYFVLFKHVVHVKMKNKAPLDITLSALDHEFVLVAFAYATVCCEFGCPLALLDRPKFLKIFLVGGLFMMQLVLAVFFKVFPSLPWLAAYLFWVPWERLWKSGAESPEAQS